MDLTVEPNDSFLVVCGGTGVGKTALLEAVFAALSPRSKGVTEAQSRLGGAEITIHIDFPDGEYSRSLVLSDPAPEDEKGFHPEATLVNLSERTGDIQWYFRVEDPAIVTEGLEPSELDPDTLDLVSRAAGKNYDEMLIYEVDDGTTVRPFFRIREGGHAYDLLGMGTGELSIAYIAWALKYASPLSILLIEEPEAFLPPTSHVAVFDLICYGAHTKQLGIVLSTHSADVVTHVPARSLLPVKRRAGTSSLVTSATPREEILERLGLRPARTNLILVEDELAAIVTTEILAAYDSVLLKTSEVVNVKTGYGAIKKALDHLPPIQAFRFAAALDGDMRRRVSQWNAKEKCVFLPFQTSMEEEFLDAISKGLEAFARTSYRALARVELELEKTIGEEAHDAFQDFARNLGMSIDQAGKRSFEHWLEMNSREKDCIDFVRSLRAALGL